MKRLGSLGDGIEQDAGDGQQGTGNQDPGAGLALTGSGAVDDAAHDDVGDGIHDLGDQGHKGNECAGESQHISIELGQIAAGDTVVGQEHDGRADKVAENFFRPGSVCRLDAGVKNRC